MGPTTTPTQQNEMATPKGTQLAGLMMTSNQLVPAGYYALLTAVNATIGPAFVRGL